MARGMARALAALPFTGLAVIGLAVMALAAILHTGGDAARAESQSVTGVALVIGQSDYRQLAKLPNPQNDATAVDRLLSDLGFEVASVSNADGRKLRRALERFVEDAAEADVALLYYSGHGIEAGGENFLVPVDADISALDDAGERLVPLSRLLGELQKVVPVTIVLLDACRDNPFPPGATVQVEAGAEPVQMGTAGLSAPRGASALSPRTSAAPAGSLGAVIGYAAAPGSVALDGEPGGNSPYAAALLKHLAAGGYPFGDVMTMVSEEVWLKTRAAQTPWTNTSLRRQLWFGGTEKEPEGDEAAIRGERRGLLLRIATLGESERQQVASRAAEGGVPMDALFAMLSAVGSEVPEDPQQFDRLLREQADRLRSILSERAALQTSDPEIGRLAALADTAVAEGALKAAIELNERAKQRVQALSGRVDDAEAQIAQRRTEFAAVYAKSAQTYALAYDYEAAARDFAAAYEQVERWNPDVAWRYKASEAEALNQHGHYRADAAATDRSVEAFGVALSLAPKDKRPQAWAEVQSGLGLALWTQGDRRGDKTTLLAAIDALRAALTVQSREATPQQWATTQGTLGAVLMTVGSQEEGTARLEEARAALQAGLEVFTRAETPREWARLQNRLGGALLALGLRQPGTELIRQGLAAFEASLAERPRQSVPFDWAQSSNNLALAYSTLAQREGRPDYLDKAVEFHRLALEVQTRERTPLLWAEGEANLGALYWQQAQYVAGWEKPAAAAASFRAALEVVPRELSPLRWAALQDNLGLALKMIGERRSDEVAVEEAIAAFEVALAERRRDRVPFQWASTSTNLANGYFSLGTYRRDAAMLEQAVALYRDVLTVNRRDSIPLEWARTTNNMGLVLHALGTLENSAERLDEAAATFRLSLEENWRDRVPLDWGLTQYNLARVLLDLGRHRSDREKLAQAGEAVRGAREAYLGAGVTDFASAFDNLEFEIQLTDLRIQVDEKVKAAGQPAEE